MAELLTVYPPSDCKTFQKKIEEVVESQEATSRESEEGNSAANLLEKLSVGDSKAQEEKTKETPLSAEKKEDENVKHESPSKDQEGKTKETSLSAEKKDDENVKP